MKKLGLMLVFCTFQIIGMEDQNRSEKLSSEKIVNYIFGFKIEGCLVKNCPFVECQELKKNNSTASLTDNRSADVSPATITQSISFKDFLDKNAERFEGK